MAKPDTFQAANDAAVDRFFDALDAIEGVEATPAETPDVDATPASGATGTTPANDDGETPDNQEGAGDGKEVVESAASTPEVVEFDPQKTLAKYKTPQDLEKAVVESQRTLLERQAENKRLRDEIETLKGAKPAETPKVETPQPADLGYDEWLARVNVGKAEELTPEEKRVQRAIASLGDEKKQLKTIESKAIELQTKANTIKAEIDDDNRILAAMVEDLKAEPDDYALEKRIEAKRAKLEKAQHTLTAVRLDLREEADRYRDAASAFNDRIVTLDREAQGLHRGIRQKKEDTATQAAATKRLNEEWNAGIRKAFDTDWKQDGFSKVEQENIETWLQKEVNDYAVKHGALPPDLYSWMKAQKAVPERARQHRVEIQKVLINRKTSDLPSKPKDNVVTPKSGKKPSSFKTGLKEAETRLDRAMSW